MSVPEFQHADLTGARFFKTQLTGAHLRMVDLSGASLRDVSLEGAEIWGSELDGLRIDGVEVAPLVEAELTRRYPARAYRRATTAEELRLAWQELGRSWDAVHDRAKQLPADDLDRSVDGEWSFTQTLRHLVLVTDGWFGAVQGGTGFHPWGVPFTGLAEWVDDVDALGLDPTAQPIYDEVLALRTERFAAVCAFLADVTDERLAEPCRGPVWAGDDELTALRCLRVLVNEECEHLRFAERDLERLA